MPLARAFLKEPSVPLAYANARARVQLALARHTMFRVAACELLPLSMHSTTPTIVAVWLRATRAAIARSPRRGAMANLGRAATLKRATVLRRRSTRRGKLHQAEPLLLLAVDLRHCSKQTGSGKQCLPNLGSYMKQRHQRRAAMD